jgi:hypothetical protein
MYTFILIIPMSVAPTCAGDLLKSIGPVRSEPGERYIVEGELRWEDGWIGITRDDRIYLDYDANEINRISLIIEKPAFFIVDGSLGNKMYQNQLLNSLPTDAGYLIDNDHGSIMDVPSYQSALLNGVDWLHNSIIE